MVIKDQDKENHENVKSSDDGLVVNTDFFNKFWKESEHEKVKIILFNFDVVELLILNYFLDDQFSEFVIFKVSRLSKLAIYCEIFAIFLLTIDVLKEHGQFGVFLRIFSFHIWQCP